MDWRQHVECAGGLRLQPAGHLFNEPSFAEEPNIDWRWGEIMCGDTKRWCGGLILGHSTRQIEYGDELMWGYGRRYTRDYEVSIACTDPA